ncbi:hypothetical protein XA68_16816 [Ophiocordyceps unilateralis]|uniref:Uncharacterized protein n=1 Tax=Ophiocordyceps unilateralis TaxID=268505 RepID=A0A2A9PKT4_OPHUN|nr:hypothetical protein XA68_16816 [Ophiocordyceps unilateralis]
MKLLAALVLASVAMAAKPSYGDGGEGGGKMMCKPEGAECAVGLGPGKSSGCCAGLTCKSTRGVLGGGRCTSNGGGGSGGDGGAYKKDDKDDKGDAYKKDDKDDKGDAYKKDDKDDKDDNGGDKDESGPELPHRLPGEWMLPRPHLRVGWNVSR